MESGKAWRLSALIMLLAPSDCCLIGGKLALVKWSLGAERVAKTATIFIV